MPSHWIERGLEPFLREGSGGLGLFPIWLLLGPRQVGKSALLHHCGGKRHHVDLDDLLVRARINADPILFARELALPLTIDEIQYAPMLLSPLKQLADAGAAPGSIWITGSQNFSVMHGVRETLAGRVALVNLLGLSDKEKNLPKSVAPAAYFESIVETGFPRLAGVQDAATRELYLSSYSSTYIERDVRELLQIDRRREFEIFVKMCALRTGCIVNLDALARDTGVSPMTIKSWLGILADSFLIALVNPYHSTHNKRLIKSPKLFFLDMGLAAFLSGWRDPEALRLGPMGGAAFETHVLSNIIKKLQNNLRQVSVLFWRTRDGEEIDFLIETGGKCFPVEVKMGIPHPASLPKLSKIAEPHWQKGIVVSLAAPLKRSALNSDWDLIHPIALAQQPWN